MPLTTGSKRLLLLSCGHLAVVLGLIGLLLPLVPTSPFMIVAAACYAQSSERFYRMLINNRHFGPAILRWRNKRCISRGHKTAALAMLAVAFTGSGVFFAHTVNARLLVAALALIPITIVALLPVCRGEQD